MSASDLLFLSTRFQALSSILANSFQHHEARLFSRLFGLLQQTIVEECCYSIQDTQSHMVNLVADRFRRLEGAAADEDGETSEEALLIGRQEIIAPLDGAPKRLLPCGKTSRSTGQHGQSVL